MKKKLSPILALLLVVLAVFFGVPGGEEIPESPAVPSPESWVQEDGETLISASGVYTSKEDVALYIHTYGCLPENL